MKTNELKKWTLAPGQDKKFLSGHPWVFSNQILGSPKGIKPGELIQLINSKGHNLALGYGNPHSLISFRELIRGPQNSSFDSAEFLFTKIKAAWSKRATFGYRESCRIVFSEADQLPGLIADLYILDKSNAREAVIVFQINTAGMELLCENLVEVVNRLRASSELFSAFDFHSLSCIIRRDSNYRKMEGLELHDIQTDLAIGVTKDQIANCKVQLPHGQIMCNLLEGQKTGLFLDQQHNIGMLQQELNKYFVFKNLNRPLKILDLCCYMGQWSIGLGNYFNEQKIKFELTMVDASELALNSAQKNTNQFEGNHKAIQADVFKEWSWQDTKFDIIVCDPPALIKSRKDIGSGQAGYVKLNQRALSAMNKNGLLVTCSCSGLLSEPDFEECILRAAIKSDIRLQKWFYGGHGPDHPVYTNFSEGQYLKMLTFLMP